MIFVLPGLLTVNGLLSLQTVIPKIQCQYLPLWHSTEIYTVRVDGSAIKRRTQLDTYAGSPCWSPDGKQIVFYEAALQQVRNMNTVMKVNATTQLSVINVSDNTKQTITKDTGEKIYPRWFADGSMAYVTWGENPGIRIYKW